MRATSISSASPTGRKVASRLSRSGRKSSGFSLSSRICLLARRPWRRRLRLEAALPSGVRGPVDFLAFSRLARMRASERGRGLSGFFVIGIGFMLFTLVQTGGRGGPVFTLMLGVGGWGGRGFLRQVIGNRGRDYFVGWLIGSRGELA